LVAFGVTIAIFLVAAVVIGLLFAMLPLGAAIPCTAIIAVTFVLLAVTVLRQLGQIGEQTFARLIDSGLNRLPGRVGAPTQDGAVEPASTEESP
jgi:membrane protein implicated in regulation of membrane protease activity